MTILRAPDTGTIIGRTPTVDGENIAVAVTLSAAVWERVTSWVGEMITDDRDSSPLSLDLRISLFLDLQTKIWEIESEPKDSRPLPPFDSDIDEDVPF